jgi:hypothetical protein
MACTTSSQPWGRNGRDQQVPKHRRSRTPQRVAKAYLRVVSKIAPDRARPPPQITRDLQAIRDEWQASATMAFGERVAQELAKLDELERTYWNAWERSCGDAERLSAKTVKDGEDERTEAVKHVEPPPCDARFLDGVEPCIKRRCEILGLNASVKIRRDPAADRGTMGQRGLHQQSAVASASTAAKAGGMVSSRFPREP